MITRTRFLLAALVSLCLLCLSTSCNQKPKKQTPIHAFIGVNTSLSARPQLSIFAALGVQTVHSLKRNEDQLSLFRVDNNTEEVSSGTISGNREQFEQTLITSLKPVSQNDNTLTEKFWTRLASLTQNETAPFLIVFFTDGYSEGTALSEHRSIRLAASQLAANPHLSGVAIVGAKTGTHEEIRADLAPLINKLGNRFLLQNDTEMTITPLLRLIQTARQQGGSHQ